MAHPIWTTAYWHDGSDDYAVRCRVTLGTPRPSGLMPSSRWNPADSAAEVEVHAVVSDTTGEAREDLVEALQEDRDFLDLVAAVAEDANRSNESVAAEFIGDARREDRRLGL